MSRAVLFKEDLELDELRETEQQLLARQREFDENRKRIAQERIERESTMPPLEEIRIRTRQRQFEEQLVSRGQVENVVRTQNRSLLLLFLLIAATCALVWWGLKLMQGV
jgi:hypothetical protein